MIQIEDVYFRSPESNLSILTLFFLFILFDVVGHPLTTHFPPSARIILDDQLLVQSGINVSTLRHLQYVAAEIIQIALQPPR